MCITDFIAQGTARFASWFRFVFDQPWIGGEPLNTLKAVDIANQVKNRQRLTGHYNVFLYLVAYLSALTAS